MRDDEESSKSDISFIIMFLIHLLKCLNISQTQWEEIFRLCSKGTSLAFVDEALKNNNKRQTSDLFDEISRWRSLIIHESVQCILFYCTNNNCSKKTVEWLIENESQHCSVLISFRFFFPFSWKTQNFITVVGVPSFSSITNRLVDSKSYTIEAL